MAKKRKTKKAVKKSHSHKKYSQKKRSVKKHQKKHHITKSGEKAKRKAGKKQGKKVITRKKFRKSSRRVHKPAKPAKKTLLPPKPRVMLVVLDGWGVGAADASNPIHMARPSTIERIMREFPGSTLQAAGSAVGLPWEEEGNSEVGHLTLGAGRVVLQHLYIITTAIEQGKFATNEVLRRTCARGAQSSHALHLVGLLSESNTHTSSAHLKEGGNAFLRFSARRSIPLHARLVK